MAQGRILKRKISTSAPVADLWERAGPEAVVLFTWMVAWWDVYGNMRGDPLWLAANIVPRSGMSPDAVADAVEAMVECGLLVMYEHQGMRYLHSPDFHAEQPNLRADREKNEVPLYSPRLEVKLDGTRKHKPKKKRKLGLPVPKGNGKALVPTLKQIEKDPHAVPEDWLDEHPGSHEVVGWWIDCQDERPPTSVIAKQGSAAKKLANDHTRGEIVRAIFGIQSLFPHSKGEAWDLFDLRRKFAKAYANVTQHPAAKEAAFDQQMQEMT